MEEIDWTTMSICPFDATHVVANLRLSAHVIKCQRHHPEKHVRMCPFNATHYIENHMYQHHILHCSDRAVIDRDIMQGSELEDGSSYSGNVGLPAYDNHIESEENWDEEETYSPFDWPNPSSNQARQPRQEPAVLVSNNQAELNRRLEERRQSRQVNSSNSFLGRPGDPRTGVNGAGVGSCLGNGAANNIRDGNGASGTYSNGAGVISVSGAGAAGGTNESSDARFAASVLVGLGRGMPAQQPLNSSPAPAIAAVGRGQAAMRAPFQQPRKVTQTAAFTLPGIGRGISSVGRGGGASGSGTRPGQGGR